MNVIFVIKLLVYPIPYGLNKAKLFCTKHMIINFLINVNDPKIDIIRNKYVVFLDVFLPYHPDTPLMNLPLIEYPDIYFSEMNSFFDLIEDKYNLEVVIAAHPSANYIGNEFNDRKIIENRTRELVRSSEFVLSHHSNSISYAILYNKDIVFSTHLK